MYETTHMTAWMHYLVDNNIILSGVQLLVVQKISGQQDELQLYLFLVAEILKESNGDDGLLRGNQWVNTTASNSIAIIYIFF